MNTIENNLKKLQIFMWVALGIALFCATYFFVVGATIPACIMVLVAGSSITFLLLMSSRRFHEFLLDKDKRKTQDSTILKINWTLAILGCVASIMGIAGVINWPETYAFILLLWFGFFSTTGSFVGILTARRSRIK